LNVITAVKLATYDRSLVLLCYM